MRYLFAFAMFAVLGCTPIATTDKNALEPAVDSAASKPDAAIVPLKTLEGSAWRVESINGIAAKSFNSREPVTVEFANGNAGGSSGCNSYGGLYLQIDDKLFLGRIITTEMGCPGTTEATLYRLLSGPVDTSFTSDGRLHLANGSDKAILARSESCVSCGRSGVLVTPPNGGDWQIVAINGAAPVGLNAFKNSENYIVHFADDGFQFSAGCNLTRGTHRREGNRLFTNIGPSTIMACSPELHEQDRLMSAIFAGNPVLVLGPNMDMLLASEAGMVELQGPPSRRK
jgi:heat shock protein HslJ